MFGPAFNNSAIKTTSPKVIIPFYIYASISFLVASVLLITSIDSFTDHFFNYKILALTHTMALGWATMIILGASHQLVPVLIEGKLHSEKLAIVTFYLAAIGIPLLVYGFYVFDMGPIAKWGGRFIIFAVIVYMYNIYKSVSESKKRNVHAVFISTSIFYLLLTVLFGLSLVYNFNLNFYPESFLHYLPLHAHVGIVGWFLLLVFGVGSRLIPLFLISKYTNTKLLWTIYFLVNTALVFYVTLFFIHHTELQYISVVLIFAAAVGFIIYCYKAYKYRLRNQVDEQVKISIFSTGVILLPILLLLVIVTVLSSVAETQINLILTYGFLIFFGWLTSIILGMTYKTLPFIVWNKVYHHRASLGKTPTPKDMFSHTIFNTMAVFYLIGIFVFAFGIYFAHLTVLNIGAVSIVITSILYNWNIIKLVTHKP